jgi:hypothetical protein
MYSTIRKYIEHRDIFDYADILMLVVVVTFQVSTLTLS